MLFELWRQGKPALGLWSAFSGPLMAEVLASVRPDYVCIDMQHGEAHDGSLVGQLQAVVAGGSTALVRVPENNPATIMRALDSGAKGIIVPLVESAEQAGQAVSACRFPPIGSRSYGPFRAQLGTPSAGTAELEDVACVVMIETQAGAEHLSEIVSTPGLTGVYVGPSDLSLALGLKPGSMDAPEVVALLGEIRAACAANGVIPGLHCHDGEMARTALSWGFSMVTVATDLRVLRSAMARELGVARGAPCT